MRSHDEHTGVSGRARRRVLRYFEPRVRQSRYSYRSVGWTSSRNQRLRFRMLCEAGDLEDRSILDVGCGVGHFYEYLKEHVNQFQYRGIDFCEDMVACASTTFPEAHFETQDVLTYAPHECFDYVVGAGIYNVSTGDNEQVMSRIVEKMYTLCSTAVAVTMTHGREFRHTIIHSYSKENMLACAQRLTPHVQIRTGFIPNHFVIYLYRP